MNRLIFLPVILAGVGCSAESATPEGGDKKKGTLVKVGGVSARTPADWQNQKPSNRLRKYQFAVPKAKGDAKDAELTVSTGGIGGSDENNLNRWKGFFIPPQGKKLDDVAKVEKLKVGQSTVTYLDVRGTYKYKKRPFAPKFTPYPNYRMFGVIFRTSTDRFFIKIIGPEKTLTEQKKSFDGWVKSLK